HNNEMKLSEEKIIKLNDKHSIVFTKSQQFKMKPEHLVVFKPQDIEISNYNDHTKISYGSLSSVIHDEKDLSSFIDTINASKYFYFSNIILLLLFIQFNSISFQIAIAPFIRHLISILLNKKDGHIPWFKMLTLIIPIPTLVLFLGMLIRNG